MKLTFGETLRRFRMEKGLSQRQLANRLRVDRTSVAHWEGSRRLPDTDMMYQLAEVLNVDISDLMASARDAGEVGGAPNVLLVDDERIILDDCLLVLRKAMPGAVVTGFMKPSQAVAFTSENPVALVFLDIELGNISGLDICRELLRVSPQTNVVFLTGYKEYGYDAWDTGACGFLVKPLSVEKVKKQLPRLRHPVGGLL